MARILDYFRRFLKDILMNSSWSVTDVVTVILHQNWIEFIDVQTEGCTQL